MTLRVGIFLLALAGMLSTSVRAAETLKPNILFILVDDFGARDLSSYGSSLHETPHMDRSAKVEPGRDVVIAQPFKEAGYGTF